MRRSAVSLSVLACAVLALSACKRTETPADAAPPAVAAAASAPAATGDAAVAANDNLNAVLWMQRAQEYRAITEQTYRAAADHLDKALKEPNWDALSWDQWVAEKKAKAIPGVVDFAKAANAKGVTLLYISNRAVHLKEATLANLREQGLPVADDSVFLGLGTVVDGCEQAGSEKNCRRRLAGQKYRVLMQFGDQLGDFVEVTANTNDGRDALLQQYHDWFGERWWMLPNPTYGGFEPAQFNNDYSQSRQARHDAKRAALDYAP